MIIKNLFKELKLLIIINLPKIYSKYCKKLILNIILFIIFNLSKINYMLNIYQRYKNFKMII